MNHCCYSQITNRNMIFKKTSNVIHTEQQMQLKYLVILSLLIVHSVHSLEQQPKATTSNLGTNADSRDANSDSSEASYETGGPEEPKEEEPSESGFQAPNELTVIRLNDTSVVLRWELDERFQERLQFFKIQYKSTKKKSDWKTDNREIPATTRAYQINGLRPGNYFFIVIAVYDNDDNVSSEQFKYKLRARSKMGPSDLPDPTAPVIHWKEAKPDFFRFKWRYTPRAQDIPWLGYLVYYRSAHTVSDFTIHATLDENVEIVDVEPDTPYEAKVVAYSQNGTSEFSETITIKTEPKPNTTTEATPISSSTITTVASATSTIATYTEEPITTRKPVIVTQDDVNKYYPSKPSQPPSSGRLPGLNTDNYQTTTSRPVVIVGPTTTTTNSNNINNNSTITSIQQCFASVIDCFKEGQNDAMTIIKPVALVLLPIMLIVFVVVCLLSRHRGNQKDSPPSKPDDSMQFDLEINGYFKNSFPGVEKEYPPVTAHSVNQGFINNHPHINDFA